MHKYFFRILVMICLFVAGIVGAKAQDILKAKDLSQVRVDQMTDGDISKLKIQISNSGMTIEQVEQMALSKGMPASEVSKLKQRLSGPETKNVTEKTQNPTGRTSNSSDAIDTGKYNSPKPKPLIDPLIFGSELYTSVSPSFEPNTKLATPINYVLGPDDQILVSVYGVQEYNGDLLVSPEGAISIPNVGQVKVAGLTIEAATQKLKTVMGNSIYPYLRTGGAKLSVTLSKIRSIRITVIGSNRPANYTLSSLSTVFNALYVAGGPSAFGSFREIELLRDNKVERKIDLYRFLLHGDQSDNIGLKDNDVIRIPPYRARVEIQGQVKRPGIFEVLPGESFAQILAFASGFTDTAYMASVKILQRNNTERQVRDLTENEYNSYLPKSGDIFVVSKILNRFANRVKISGAVFRPDIYELSPGLRVGDLIRKADGIVENAFTGRARIIRYEDDLTRSILSFDVRKALGGDDLNNILLRREDEVIISSIQDLRDSFKVTIQGEIRMPGDYEYLEKLTLKDLIIQAGGFTDAAYKNIEIARMIKRDSILIGDTRESEIFNIEINSDLSSALSNIPLQPFDVITIRKKAGYLKPESVTVSGEVQYPGPYAISRRTERVSDLLKRAGGYTASANPMGAYLRRYKTKDEKRKSEEIAQKVQKNLSDSTEVLTQEIRREFDQIPLNMDQVAKSPGSIEDLILRANDELIIPKFDDQIRITGSVLLATQVPYNAKNSFVDYISAAGGFSANAWRRKAYLVYANGKAATTKHFLFVKSYPKVLPGSEIVVPKKAEKKGSSVAEIISISTAAASLAGVLIALLRL